jgi:hypothetical protein
MAEKSVSLEISGDPSGLIVALNQAREAVAESTAQMKEHMASLGESTKAASEAFLAFGALLAGGGAFKEIVSATQEWTESAKNLSLILGISAEKASAYHVAIKEVGGNVQDFDSAIVHLTRQIKTHEKGLNDMGIATRDSSGNLLDAETIYWSAIEAVNSYKAGTDRNLAAQAAFGRGMDATNAIFRMHRDEMEAAAETAKKLALIVGKDSIAAFEVERKSLADTSLKFEAMKIQLGNELIPAIVGLGEAFSGNATTAGKILSDILTFMGKAVLALVGGVREWATAFAGMGAAASAIIHGNFSEIGGIYDQTMEMIHEINAETDAAIAKLDKPIPRPKMEKDDKASDDGKAWKPPAPEKNTADLRFQEYKKSLDDMRQAAEDFSHKDIAADLEFWQAKLAITTKNTEKDKVLRLEIGRQINELEKKLHAEKMKMAEDELKEAETLALGELDIKREALAHQAALGNISRAQQVKGEIDLENEKYRIELQALEDRLKLARFDLVEQKKLKDAELTLEQKHALAVQKLTDKMLIDEAARYTAFFKGIENGFQHSLAAMLNGTQTFTQGIHGMFRSVTDSIGNAFAAMVTRNIASLIRQAVVTHDISLKAIFADAYKAASGAYAATVGIPYIGPFIAPAAAAVAFGAVSAFGSSIPSAAGGYDIPAGINPITQLHQNEMVLPAPLADAVRSMTNGTSHTTVNLPATSMGDHFMVHRDALKRAIKQIVRDGGVSFA